MKFEEDWDAYFKVSEALDEFAGLSVGGKMNEKLCKSDVTVGQLIAAVLAVVKNEKS